MILARHAESLFWAGRYLERAEITSRWLEVANRFSMNLLPADAEIEWRILIGALGAGHDLQVPAEGVPFDPTPISDALLTEVTVVGSVAGAVLAMRDNLRVVRDRVPVELWEEANQLRIRLDDSAAATSADTAPHATFRTVREGCQAISGVVSESMMRDEGHAFIVIGRMLERSTLTVRLLAASLNRPTGLFDGDRILRSSSALQAYRRLHGHGVDEESVTSFLLLTPGLPRSVRSCLVHAEARLAMVDPASSRMKRTQQLVGRLRSNLEFGDFEASLDGDSRIFLGTIEASLRDIGAALDAEVFRPMGEPVLHSQFVRPGLDH